MRILLVPSSYAPNLGGIEYLTAALAREFKARGNAASVLTNRWPEALAEAEVVDGAPVTRVAMPAPRLHLGQAMRYPAARRRARAQIEAVMQAWRPDVVLAIGVSWQAVHTGAAARRLGIPVVINLQGETAMDDHQIFQRSLLLRRALRRLLAHAALVTANSRWTLDHARRTVGHAVSGVVIPNGVDHEELSKIPEPLPGVNVVLAYGRLVRNKGFDLLLAAARELPGVRFELGGAGPEEGPLRATAATANAEVRFLGRLDRRGVHDALTRAAVVAVPSRMEPFGIVALEAMAAGRPVVASSIGGIPEFLRGGLCVDPSHPARLAAALRDALAHPRWGAEGRVAAEALAWPRVAERWLQELRGL